MTVNMPPKLLYYSSDSHLSEALLEDLKLRDRMSLSTMEMIKKRADREEIGKREEVFAEWENENALNAVQKCLAILKDYERSLTLFRLADTAFERYRLHIAVLENYMLSCQALSSLCGNSSRVRSVSEYFARVIAHICERAMPEDVKKAKELFCRLRNGRICFSDRCILKTGEENKDEYDELAEYGRSFGFDISSKKKYHIKPDKFFSDAIIDLHKGEAEALDRLFLKYADTDFHSITEYIRELEFYTEILDFMKKAEQQGIPHCYPKIAPTPRYTAKEAYDISLISQVVYEIVPNDIRFDETEPFCFLVGANGGGKTTYPSYGRYQFGFVSCGLPCFCKGSGNLSL